MNVIEAGGVRLEPQVAAHAAEMFVVLSDPAIFGRATGRVACSRSSSAPISAPGACSSASASRPARSSNAWSSRSSPTRIMTLIAAED